MGEAVAAILQAQGRDEVELLYGRINRIIKEIDPEPGDALRDLARIDDLRTFVSTTPDRLLAKALNDVRFRGRGLTRELAFSPNQSTSEQARNAQTAAPTDTVVLNLFGQAASTPEYAIHEEDRLEWLHALLPDAARLPGWLAHKLRHQPMLFIGCEIPDWIGRFLLRLSSTERLSDERKQFFFVGSSNAHVPSLSDFFATYCRRPLVQQLEMEPTAFVSELCGTLREARRRDACRQQRHGFRIAPLVLLAQPHRRFSSATCARMQRLPGQLRTAITRLGGEVWLDERSAWKRVMSGRKRAPDSGYRRNCSIVRPDHLGEDRAGEGRLRLPGVGGGGWTSARNLEWPLHRACDHRRRLRRRPEPVPERAEVLRALTVW